MHVATQVVYCYYIILTHFVECLWYDKFDTIVSSKKIIEWIIKGQAMALKINILWYNIFVFRQWSPFLREKYGPILPVLVGLMAGWQTIWVDFKILKILYWLNYLGFYFVNINAILLVSELHFNQLFSNKVYLGCVLRCINFSC